MDTQRTEKEQTQAPAETLPEASEISDGQIIGRRKERDTGARTEEKKKTERNTINGYFQTFFSQVISNPKRSARRILVYLPVIYILWQYLSFFMGLSFETAQQVSLNVPIGGTDSPAYYPIGDQVMIIGGICLTSFVLIQNEISLRTIRNAREYESYITTVFAFMGFLFFLWLADNIYLSPRTQRPFLILGGSVLTGMLLIQDEMKDLSLLVLKSLRNPKDAPRIWGESWKRVGTSLFAILAFFFILINLAMVGTFFPIISREQDTTFSFLLLLLIIGWSAQISRESDKPSIVYKRQSSLAFLIALPFVLFLTFRIMLLLRTDATWDITWDFMDDIAGFSITNWPNQVNLTRGDRWEFHWAGVVNAVRAVLISIVLCTLIGIVVGVMRLSNHKLTSGFGTVYVEIFRNMPLALLLFGTSITLGNTIPIIEKEVNIAEAIWISNQGIIIPKPDPIMLTVALSWLLMVKAYTTYLDREGFDDSDRGIKSRFRIWISAFAIAAGMLLYGGFDIPTMWKRIPDSPGSWVMQDGFEITLPFLAIVAGLTIYTSAIVAEIVRGSIQSLPRGQIEAGIALGLTPLQRLRLVIMPQALRSMVPALNNQYMNVWKNSSLAMIVAYNDVFYINLVIVNKIGKAVPTFILILLTYQVGSLIISALMNMYNRRITRVQI